MDIFKLSFIFSNLDIIVLGVWLFFLIVVAIRFFRPGWVKDISYLKLILIALGLNISYGLFVTWGQYYVWANGDEITKTFVNTPLSKEVPLLFEWMRMFFENHYGYFLYYILGRIWLYIFILFLISGIFYLVLKVWQSYRGGFQKQGPEVILLLMLISGYPGVLVFVPLGFVFSIILFVFYYVRAFLKKIKGVIHFNIEPAFIFAAFFALLFTRIVLLMLQL